MHLKRIVTGLVALPFLIYLILQGGMPFGLLVLLAGCGSDDSTSSSGDSGPKWSTERWVTTSSTSNTRRPRTRCGWRTAKASATCRHRSSLFRG